MNYSKKNVYLLTANLVSSGSLPTPPTSYLETNSPIISASLLQYVAIECNDSLFTFGKRDKHNTNIKPQKNEQL